MVDSKKKKFSEKEKENTSSPEKNLEKKENYFLLASYIMIFTNIFLLISSYWFKYNGYFYVAIILVSLILLVPSFLRAKNLLYLILVIGGIFYGYFLYLNYNYTFVLASSVVLGFLVLHFLRPHLNIPHFVYSFLPLFILLHIVWFNILPLGFTGAWNLNFGEKGDDSLSSDLYIIDEKRVLSPTQTYGTTSWRSFEKDGSFQVGFNTPVDFTGKFIELEMDYEAAGPIYINGELFYDPAWGSSINIGDYGEEFIYGAEKFNLTIPFYNVSMETFLNITNSSSLEDYILDKYETNLVEHDGDYLGRFDLWLQREEILSETNVSNILESKFYKYYYLNISFDSIEDLLVNLSANSLDEIFRSPLELFLYQRNMTLGVFLDEELNNGPYPKERVVQKKYESIEEYLRDNFPDGVAMIDFTGKYSNLENEMNNKYIEKINTPSTYSDWSSEPKVFDATIRGPVTFYALFENSIELSVLKQDFNWYNGSDEVTILVSDFNGTIVANWTIDDVDGIDERTSNSSIVKKFDFSQNLENSGIYKIEFFHKYYNQHSDFILRNLSFNSNKAMIEGRFLLWSPAKFYNFEDNNILSARYWWNNYDQDITFNDGTIFSLTKEDKNVRKDIEISRKKSLSFQKGFLDIIPSKKLALWETSYIDTNVEKSIHITKSFEFENYNLRFVELDGLNISSTKGTKIYNLVIYSK